MIKHDVGRYAGDVYSLLSERGRLSLRRIGELTKKREAQIFLSLGWLMREGKIHVSEQNGELYFELDPVMNEVYY